VVTDVTNLCFVHALLHNTSNFIVYRSISMKLRRRCSLTSNYFDHLLLLGYMLVITLQQCDEGLWW